ncbi:uncharacterized protein LOC132914800 [Bombus pascuorum]|uniref:uncharacterized protein LOC132914800 n=1 Tax=Bombus pascuorum TaxID=65598 RepID=UPI00298E1366|nr:uncharacterized protein LOC132914800 [Bombus pascuorum]
MPIAEETPDARDDLYDCCSDSYYFISINLPFLAILSKSKRYNKILNKIVNINEDCSEDVSEEEQHELGQSETDTEDLAGENKENICQRLDASFLSPSRSEDEESCESRSTVASVTSRRKKRKIVSVTPEVPDHLRALLQATLAMDVNAEVLRHLTEVMKVAATSSNLKGTYIKTLWDAVGYVMAAWTEQVASSSSRKIPGPDTNQRPSRTEEKKKRETLEEENEVLRKKYKELSKRMARMQEGTSGVAAAAAAPEKPVRPDQEKDDINLRVATLERQMDKLGPWIIRAIDELLEGLRLGVAQQRKSAESMETRSYAIAAGSRPPPPPSQGASRGKPAREEDWQVVVPRKARRRAREDTGNGGRGVTAKPGSTSTTYAPPLPPARVPRKGGGKKEGSGNRSKAGMMPRVPSTWAPALPQAPRSSAVTLTLSEGSSKSYAEVLAKARKSQILQKCGLEKVQLRRAVTGAIVISVPDDAGKVKATQLATHLSKVLDASTVKVWAPTTMAELKLVEIDISLEKDEIQEELAKVAGCEAAEIKVWETGASRSGMGTAFVKCPAAGARKLALAGAWNWGTLALLACHRWSERTYVIDVERASTELVAVWRLPQDAPYASHEGHRRTTGCRPPKVARRDIRRATARRNVSGKKEEGASVGAVTEAMAQARIASATEATQGGTRKCNLGRARRAQDLLYQTIRQSGTDLAAVVAEPYNISEASNWIGDVSGLVAITWSCTTGISGSLVGRGNGFAAVQWSEFVVVSVYISPNCGTRAFEDFLDEMGECIRRCLPRQVLVLGDFNAHSTQWGNNRTTARGRELTNWTAGLRLLLINQGSVSTCVGWRGTSVIDLTWATPRLHARIHNWRVTLEMETLSDHIYVLMEIQPDGKRR